MIDAPVTPSEVEESPTTDEMFEHFRLLVDKGQEPLRIDKFIATHQEDTSRHRVQQAIKLGYVLVNDKVVKANYIVRPCDVVKFVMPYERRGTEILPENIPLDIVYEDNDVLVVNKPAGMVVHPGHGNYNGTLVNALAYYLHLSPDVEDERMGVLVHRIDKDTSGLLVVAKNPAAQLNLADQFFVHSIDRVYTAVVWGNIVLERFGFITVVECRLETGRTHQIRVHMASTGHPLFNDERYGGSEIRQGTIYAKYKQFIQNCFALCPRQALHARTLGFTHPVTGQRLHFEAPLPADMAALIEKWRLYTASM